MRKIGIDDVEDIALGASLLGAGGGGDPYTGRLMAISAIKKYGEVDLITVDEVPDDALIVPIAMMGAPTILAEKGVGKSEFDRLVNMLERYFGRKIYATMPAEAGGVNSLVPVAAAAQLGIPLVDADSMGRAFPELQMSTFTIGGASASPMAWADEKGNTGIMDTANNKWTEDIGRAITLTCGGNITIALFPVFAKMLKEYGVHGIVTRAQQLGRAIRNVKNIEGDMTPREHFLKFSGAYPLFAGKITDVLRETRGAFNFGKVVLAGIDDDRGGEAFVEFQNENLRCVANGKTLATTPDLICLVDIETFQPVPTDALKYGKRVLVVGLECFHLWRTQSGLDLVGPRYFGIDADYIPVEERCKLAACAREDA